MILTAERRKNGMILLLILPKLSYPEMHPLKAKKGVHTRREIPQYYVEGDHPFQGRHGDQA